MFLRRYQWLLGVVWIVVAILIAAREWLLSSAINKLINPEKVPLIVLMACVFAAWNFARWYAYSQSRYAGVMENPLRARRHREDDEPNPVVE
ncbi:MAG: hypothetical protein U0798_15505 [Gemmataceae bacterium]